MKEIQYDNFMETEGDSYIVVAEDDFGPAVDNLIWDAQNGSGLKEENGLPKEKQSGTQPIINLFKH